MHQSLSYLIPCVENIRVESTRELDVKLVDISKINAYSLCKIFRVVVIALCSLGTLRSKTTQIMKFSHMLARAYWGRKSFYIMI